MVKVKIKNEKKLKEAKEKLQGQVDFRKTKEEIIAGKSKWPKKNKN